MKLSDIPILVAPLLGLCLLPDLGTPTARASSMFGEPLNLGPQVNAATFEASNSMTPDGLLMVGDGIRLGGQGSMDVWMMTRETVEGEWNTPVNPAFPLNTSAWDGVPSISADGLMLSFASLRPGGQGGMDLWTTTRRTRDDPWPTPVNLGPPVNSSSDDWSPCISTDQLELYFMSTRPGGRGGMDLWRSTRPSVDETWGQPVNLGPTINSPSDDMIPNLTTDGLCMFFHSTRSGGYGDRDMWVTTRATRHDDWRTPVNPGPPLNSPYMDGGAIFSPDGSTLYFWSYRPGGYGSADLWQVSIAPIVDFNGDGNVDAMDMTLLVANWGENATLCDIGPYPWGDGVVDERDLRVLMESLMTPAPGASDVPYYIVLNWVTPSIAKSCDVYLGTSFEAVSTADRDHPLDVLVSWGQKEATYAPETPLEFSQTYYWRVDTVLGPANISICKGPVLSFTTEPFARPIQNVTAAASSFQPGLGPEKTVNGSGLDQNDRHSTTSNDMWLSQPTGPHWIQYEFDKVYTLHELWVWNSNQMIEPFLGLGAKTVKIEYSTDGTTWTTLDGVPEFARAPGQPGYVHNTTVGFGGVAAKYVKLTIEKPWGSVPSVGLSEVRFFHIPDRPLTKP